MAGQRRFNAHHWLNKEFPGEKFPESEPEQKTDEIKCIVIPEPKSDEKKLALSVAENITHVHMSNTDSVKAVTDLWNTYHDYDDCREKFGLTKYMVDKFVALARLPQELKDAINEGAIHSNQKTAENCALRAVDALGWVKGGEISVKEVLDLAIVYASGEIEKDAIDEEAKKGGTAGEIGDRAKKKVRTKFTLSLSKEIAEKLQKVSAASGEKENTRAAGYVNKGVTDDFDELDDTD